MKFTQKAKLNDSERGREGVLYEGVKKERGIRKHVALLE
jgi:hypothetical protein